MHRGDDFAKTRHSRLFKDDDRDERKHGVDERLKKLNKNLDLPP